LDLESHRDLRVLEAVAADGRTTQRRLSDQLGIALGLTNLYLKRLARKGFIKCVNMRANRVRYLITPTGIAEKTRLTYEFMEYSLQLYRESRNHLRVMLEPCAASPRIKVAIFGTGEAAELAYLCLKELGVEPVAVFETQGGSKLFDMPVRPIGDHATVPFDTMIVATLEDPAKQRMVLEQNGIGRERLLLLRQPRPAAKSR
jgi:DNA-binding Lrp family transcriptional regulator